MMSEKRFTMYKNDHTLIDNLTGHICEFPNQKYAETCCKWLNELWQENEQLQEEIKRLGKMIWKIQWRFQQEVGIEKAREHYREIDKEMNDE